MPKRAIGSEQKSLRLQGEKPKKILVVEDEDLLREAIVNKLSREGFTVGQAVNGVQGLEQALALKPDLIFLDILMPRMDGVRMLSRLRAHRAGRDMRVIILTNLSDTEMIDQTLAEKIDGYLVKSDIDLSELTRVAKDLFSLP